MSRYDVNSILESSTLPIGGAAKRLKEASEHIEASVDGRRTDIDDNITSQLTDGGITSYGTHHLHHGWPTIAFQQAQAYHYSNYGAQARGWCKQEQDAAAVTAAHSLQDIQQLHLSNNTHNFFQPSVMHNLMSMDSSPMEHSTGSNSIVYNGSIGGSSGSYMGGNGGGYVMPISTMVVDQSNGNQASSSFGGDSDNNMLAATDPYTGRSVYYPTGVVKENSVYDQNAWMASSVQGMSQRSGSNIGAPLFTVWNDA